MMQITKTDTTLANIVKILHISDLHFYSDAQTYNMKEILLREAEAGVQGLGERQKLLIITGDFHNYNDADYFSATDFLNRLINVMDLDKTQDVFVVPGNHDVRIGASTDPLDMKAWTDKLKDGDFAYLEKRLAAYGAYCDFVKELGVYVEEEDKFLPAKVHLRQWRGQLNLLHLNTTLAADGKEKPNQMVDVHTAANDAMWASEAVRNLPALALGHNQFYDLREVLQPSLKTTFQLHHVSAYLCGDTHLTDIPQEYQMIPVSAERSPNRTSIPNIVCAKSIADMSDNYSDFGYYWHTWDQKRNEVKVSFRRWKPTSLGKTYHDELGDYSYEMVVSTSEVQDLLLDDLFEQYLLEEFQTYQKRDIAVSTPQLLSITLRYPTGRVKAIFNEYKYKGKPFGDQLQNAMNYMDAQYKKDGKRYDSQQLHSFYETLGNWVKQCEEELRQEECITPWLFCWMLLYCSGGATAKLVQEKLGTDYLKAMSKMRQGKVSSIPAGVDPFESYL